VAIKERLLGYLNADFPDLEPITKDIRDENTKRFFTGGVRINSGLYRTKAEDELYRKSSLQRKLP